MILLAKNETFMKEAKKDEESYKDYGANTTGRLRNPSMNQLGLLALPTLLCMVYCLIIKDIPAWVLWFCGIDIGVVTFLIFYFCIKQKCYLQLVAAIVALGILVGALLRMVVVFKELQ